MMDTRGPALDEANRTVRDISARLRRYIRNPNSNNKELYALQDRLGDAVYHLTTLLVTTLRGMGYKAYTSSDSHYLMIDEYVHVELGNADLGMWYELVVWSFSKPRFRVQIVGGWYDEVIPPLTIYERAGITLDTMQELLDSLGSIRATIDAHAACVGCYYSSEGGHCGLGKVPIAICNDRQLTTGD